MIELSRRTYKRIVVAYLLTMVIGLIATIIELMVHWEFSNEFDALSARYFGTPTDREFAIFGAVAIPALIAHFCAAIGLLRFRRWARSLVWMSLLAMMIPMAFPSLSMSWSNLWSVWIEIIAGGLFGMIILVSYATNFGADWFSPEPVEVKVEDNG